MKQPSWCCQQSADLEAARQKIAELEEFKGLFETLSHAYAVCEAENDQITARLAAAEKYRSGVGHFLHMQNQSKSVAEWGHWFREFRDFHNATLSAAGEKGKR